ncbi:unnamed protein product [Onchocerca flexuosa]|uniref:Uncharacterized protein n=1 Tax=Onchocerca flexuosa TaxID=387005 RepID=A0A183GYS9_9BILA|nr:unnamed protein product [Onchocerca flexuosa]
MFYQCLGLLFVVSINAINLQHQLKLSFHLNSCSIKFILNQAIFSVPLPEELDYDGEIPNCRDGGKPLLAADIGVYTCDKNCPKGFRCEYRTMDSTSKKGVVNISFTKSY